MLLDRMSQRYGKRPSEIIGIDDEIVAFDFDCAVMMKATMLEHERAEKGEELAPEEELERLKAQFNTIGFGYH